MYEDTCPFTSPCHIKVVLTRIENSPMNSPTPRASGRLSRPSIPAGSPQTSNCETSSQASYLASTKQVYSRDLTQPTVKSKTVPRRGHSPPTRPNLFFFVGLLVV